MMMNARYVPRSVFLDLEPSVIDEVSNPCSISKKKKLQPKTQWMQKLSLTYLLAL